MAQSTSDAFQLVRQRISTAVSHPRALRISMGADAIKLEGPILDSEVERVISVASDFGLRVDNQLSVLRQIKRAGKEHSDSRDQISIPSPSEEQTVSPWMRAGFGLLGAALIYSGWKKENRLGGMMMAAGLGGVFQMLSGPKANRLIQTVFSPVVRVERQIKVDASTEFAYRWWTDFDHYARFMSYVSEVQVNDRGGLTWKMSGPAGVPFSWDATITKMDENRIIKWQSEPESPLINSGSIRFHPMTEESCWIGVTLTYEPPAGILGYSLVKLLGFDPTEKIDADLLVMRELIEEEYRTASPERAAPIR